MDEDSLKLVVTVVVAILAVSLLINAFLAADRHAFSSPPVRVAGYFTAQGEPVPGYYIDSSAQAPHNEIFSPSPP